MSGCPHCLGPDHVGLPRKPRSAKAMRYDEWRIRQGAPAFPASNDVLCLTRGRHAITATWTMYHAAEAAYEAWARKQPFRWQVEDFLRRPW